MMMLSALRTWGRLAAFGVLLSACTASPDPGPAKAAKVEEKAAVAGRGAEEPTLPDANKLLADAVEAMGGAAKFATVTSYYAESQVELSGLGLTGAAKVWWRGGDFSTEMAMPGVGLMRTGSLAGKPWGDDPINGVRALAGKEAEQAAWSATLCLAHEWQRFFKTAETTAVKQAEGKQIAEVTLTSALGDRVVMRFDLASKLPVSQSFSQASPLGETPATISFEDFRVVDGMKIPFKQVLDASLTRAVATTSKLEFNGSSDDMRYAMPSAPVTVTPGVLVDGAKIDPEQAATARAAAEKAAVEKAAKPEKRKPGKG